MFHMITEYRVTASLIKLFDCSEKGYALRLNETDKLNNMHRETV